MRRRLLRLVVRARIAQHPDRQYRHKGTGKQIRPHHREADCQRQRYEQVMRSAGHEEGGNKHRQNAKHRHEPWQRRLGRGLARGAGKDATIASGMFKTTTSELRQSRRKSSTIKPVSTAPSAPSKNRPWMARVT